jgi:hypothetical protein
MCASKANRDYTTTFGEARKKERKKEHGETCIIGLRQQKISFEVNSTGNARDTQGFTKLIARIPIRRSRGYSVSVPCDHRVVQQMGQISQKRNIRCQRSQL